MRIFRNSGKVSKRSTWDLRVNPHHYSTCVFLLSFQFFISTKSFQYLKLDSIFRFATVLQSSWFRTSSLTSPTLVQIAETTSDPFSSGVLDLLQFWAFWLSCRCFRRSSENDETTNRQTVRRRTVQRRFVSTKIWVNEPRSYRLNQLIPFQLNVGSTCVNPIQHKAGSTF